MGEKGNKIRNKVFGLDCRNLANGRYSRDELTTNKYENKFNAANAKAMESQRYNF